MRLAIKIFLFVSMFGLGQSCSGPMCRSNDECLRGQFCTPDGLCLEGCASNNDCEKGKTCSKQGRCVTHVPGQETNCTNGQQRSCSNGDKKLHNVGVCRPGIQTCTGGKWGACLNEILPSNEVCDKQDNDCDGQIDEDLKNCECSVNTDCPAQAPNCQQGRCIRFCSDHNQCTDTQTCKTGYCQACPAGSARSKKEECNGKDDNCDGNVDEGLTQECGKDEGACQKGVRSCVKGTWGSCVGEVKETKETCNGKDDDCDGEIDEAPLNCFIPAQLKETETLNMSGQVYSARFTADGSKLVTTSSDRYVRLWDLKTAKVLSEYYNSNYPYRARFSPDETLAAYSDWEGYQVRFFDVSTGQANNTMLKHNGYVHDCQFTKNGKQLIAGDSRGQVILWDLSNQTKIKTFTGHVGTVQSVIFSPDEKHVISAGQDKTIRIWEVASGKEVRQLSGHTASVQVIQASSDGKTIFSAGDDSTIRIWDFASGKQRNSIAAGGAVHALAIHANGNYFAAGVAPSYVKVWGILSNNPLATLSHTNRVRDVRFGPDGKSIISASEDRTVKIWK